MIRTLIKIPFLKRIIPSLIKRLNLKNIKYRRENLTYNLDLRYLVDRRFFLYGWDDDVIENLNYFISNNKCEYFLDIGSCWGVYSLKIAYKNPNLKVLAFDVFEKNIRRLKFMANNNNIININTFNKAIGSEKKLELFSVNEEYSPNFSKDLNGNYKIEVQQDLIDNLVQLSKKNIVMKIDVERAELGVLEGSKNILKNNNCLILIETKENSKAINFLLYLGFKILPHSLNTEDIILTNYEW